MFLKNPQIEHVIQEILLNGFSGNNINSGKIQSHGPTLATSKHTESVVAMFGENDPIFTLKDSCLDMNQKTTNSGTISPLEQKPSTEYIKF